MIGCSRLLALLLLASAASAGGQKHPAPLLVKDIRGVGAAQPAPGSRLQLRGVVTALSGWKNSFFFQDATGGISVDRKDNADVNAGDKVEIDGVSGPGLFAPVVVADHVRVLGPGRLPVPHRFAYEDLAGGKQDSQWVEVRGIVHSAAIVDSWGRQVLSLVIEIGGGTIVARLHDFQPEDPGRLVDATIVVRGVCGTNFNAKRQFVGLRLFVPDLSFLHVEEAAPSNPFAIPQVPIERLLQFDPARAGSHRVEVSGIATHQGLGRTLYLQDGEDAILVETSQGGIVEPGSRVEAVGFVAPGEYSPVLRNAIFQKLAGGKQPIPKVVIASDVIQAKDGFAFAPYGNSLVRMEAEIIERIQHAQQWILVLRSAGILFQARIEPGTNEADLLENIKAGTRVQLTGICVVEADQDREPRAFHILLASALDIRVLKTPWWTISNSLWLAGFLLLLSLGMLAWVVQLRRALPANVPDVVGGDTRIYSDFRMASRMAGWLGMFVGLVVLVGGWGFNIASLRSVLPGYAPMRVNTALGFVLAGAALWLDQAGTAQAARRRLVQICAGLTGLLGLATVIEYVFGTDLGIDALLFREQNARFLAGVSARMAITSSVGFLLLGSALLLIHRRRGFIIGQYLVGVTGALCLFNVVGYLYGIKQLYGISSYTAMALHTSLTFLLLCAGVVLSRPHRGFMSAITSGSPGGVMARRLLPAAMLIPAGLGWLRWQGQIVGLFDTAFGLALFASSNIVVFALLIWSSAGRLNRLDVERSLAEGNLRDSEQQFRSLLESAPDAMVMADAQGRIVLVNAKTEILFGYSRKELLGEPVDKLIPSHVCRAPRIGQLDSALDLCGVKKDASEFPAEISLSPIRTAQGLWTAAIRDITVRKAVEERLRESEDRYRTVVDSLPQMVWTCLPDGSCDFLSRQWIEYTGSSEADHIGFKWVEQVHPDDRESLQKLWAEAVREGGQFDAEYRIRSSRGDYRWFRGLAIPLRDSSSAITKWFGTSTEIEKLKSAEAALRDSEASFRQLADAMPQIVWTSKPDGNLDYYNQRWYDYTGMTFDQTKDWGWQPVVHPDDLHNCISRWTRAFSTGELYEVEYRFKRASDGEYRWHLGRALPIFNGEGHVVRWFGTCTDIEDYKQAEKSILSLNENLEEHVQNRTLALARANLELAKTKSSLQGLLDAATQVSIIAADMHGIIQVFNSGAEKMLQYSAREMEGVRTPAILHVSAECLERSELLTSEFGRPIEGVEVFMARARLDQTEEREWTYVRKDGSQLDVSLAITAVRNSSGILEGFLGIATDITARKSLERELRLNNEKLVEQTRRAEEANRAKSDFLAAMSHEIRTPMNAILGMADVLWDSDLDTDQRQYVEVFRRAGSSLLALINDILDLSKIEAGHFELERIEFDLEDIVDQSIELIAPKARAKNIALLARLSPGVPTALIGDPTRLRQVLINLLGNAVKFTESGEVLLTVQQHDSGVAGRIQFAVSDTGIGIPEKMLETIFDDFTQADSSTTRKYGGTGLGLGISLRLVQQMGGGLTVTSTVGEGSTFRFEASFEPGFRTQLRTQVADFHGRRVLVIDDNATNRLILRETLNTWGLETDECSLPEKAFDSLSCAIAEGRSYSLVLLDNRMPGLNGFQTAARINKLDPKVPIIMLTSDAQAGDAARRREVGIAGYAVKPVKRAELLRLVCDAMQDNDGSSPQQLYIAPVDRCATVASGDPMRILVAEDSPDNRLLIQVYLKGSPHQVTFVEDGYDAVERFTAADFDLILMDMQMPVMDGLVATRTIRAIERERGLTPIPIVALTANARPQDVSMSQDAGCTAHLAKPISKQKLLNAIQEFGRQAAANPLRIEMPEGLEELVPDYLEARRREVPQMLQLLAASDFERLHTLAHNMKGTGTSYGLAECTRLGAELEHSATQSDGAALQGQLAELESYLERIVLV